VKKNGTAAKEYGFRRKNAAIEKEGGRVRTVEGNENLRKNKK